MAGKKRAEQCLFLQTVANSHIFFRFIVKNGGGGDEFSIYLYCNMRVLGCAEAQTERKCNTMARSAPHLIPENRLHENTSQG